MTKQAKTLNERELQRLLDFIKTTKSAARILAFRQWSEFQASILYNLNQTNPIWPCLMDTLLT